MYYKLIFFQLLPFHTYRIFQSVDQILLKIDLDAIDLDASYYIKTNTHTIECLVIFAFSSTLLFTLIFQKLSHLLIWIGQNKTFLTNITRFFVLFVLFGNILFVLFVIVLFVPCHLIVFVLVTCDTLWFTTISAALLRHVQLIFFISR